MARDGRELPLTPTRRAALAQPVALARGVPPPLGPPLHVTIEFAAPPVQGATATTRALGVWPRAGGCVVAFADAALGVNQGDVAQLDAATCAALLR